MKSNATCDPELRVYLDTLPLIDCHDHARMCPKPIDSIAVSWLFYNPNEFFKLVLISGARLINGGQFATAS
jgi:hypothetical protein